MSWVDDIRQKVGIKKLDAAIKKHEEFNRSMEFKKSTVRSLGILLPVKTEKDIECAHKIVAIFSELRVIAKIIALDRNDDITRIQRDPTIDVLYKKDLDWFFLPKLSRVEYFLSQNFDMLVNLSTENDLALNYIAATTGAKIKIGFHDSETENIYHMMFSPKGKKDLLSLTNNIVHYLELAK